MPKLRDGVILVPFLLALLFPVNLYGWRDVGHEVVCEIAFQELNAKAKAEVIRLIRLDPEFSTFSASCTWPDHPGKRRGEHYVNLPRSSRGVGSHPCPAANKCVVTAVAEDHAVLGDSSASDRKKLRALKFLGHWVGDIHQPLHVSFEDDRGGGRIDVSGLCEHNLHFVWDDCIIVKKLGTNVRQIAQGLRASLKATDKNAWIGTAPKEWANESFSIALSESLEYCVKRQDGCWYDANKRTHRRGETERIVRVDDAYVNEHAPTVRKRLLQAGVRLGAMLNQALGSP